MTAKIPDVVYLNMVMQLIVTGITGVVGMVVCQMVDLMKVSLIFGQYL